MHDPLSTKFTPMNYFNNIEKENDLRNVYFVINLRFVRFV